MSFYQKLLNILIKRLVDDAKYLLKHIEHQENKAKDIVKIILLLIFDN